MGRELETRIRSAGGDNFAREVFITNALRADFPASKSPEASPAPPL
jgi:hypothetical protein